MQERPVSGRLTDLADVLEGGCGVEVLAGGADLGFRGFEEVEHDVFERGLVGPDRQELVVSFELLRTKLRSARPH